MDGLFGHKPAHVSARRTAIFGMLVTALIYVVYFIESKDGGPWWNSVKAVLPLALFFIACFGFVVIQLRRGPDREGLAMGIAFPTTVLMLLVYGVIVSYQHGSSESQMGMLYSFLFFFASPSWALFLWLMIPTLILLLYKSVRASLMSEPIERPHFPALAAFAMLSVAGYESSWGMVRSYDADSPPAFSADKAAQAIEPLYLCLWRIGSDDPNGRAFPKTLDAIRTVDGKNERDRSCAKALDQMSSRLYAVDYKRPTRHSFQIRVVETEYGGESVHTMWVDHTGVMREALKTGNRLDSVSVINAAPLASLLLAQAWLERIASRTAVHEYPEQLTYASPTDRRPLIYTPRRNSSGRVTGYSLLMPSTVNPARKALRAGIGEKFRSYLRDETGAIHAYGGVRDATRKDPPPQPDELARAQELVDLAKANKLAEQKHDSLLKVRSNEARKFRADSAKRDSVGRGDGPQRWYASTG